jgi:hypothetical protein
MLGDIVQNSSFPAAELERERQVILHEMSEDDDDALATADKLFDTACFRAHPLAQPVIGSRANIRRFARDELLAYVQAQYSGANVVVGVAGNVDAEAAVRDAEAAFGSLRRGSANLVAVPEYVGGVASKAQAGYSQTHVVLGFPLPSARDDDPAGAVAAALFGEGMSSPLMDEIRERRGLVYYASCTAEVNELAGLFVVEASTAPEHVDEFFRRGAPPARGAGCRHRGDRPGASPQPDGGAQPARARAPVAPARGRRPRPVRARPHPLAGGADGGRKASAPGRSATRSSGCSLLAPRWPSPASCARARSSARAICSPRPPEIAQAPRPRSRSGRAGPRSRPGRGGRRGHLRRRRRRRHADAAADAMPGGAAVVSGIGVGGAFVATESGAARKGLRQARWERLRSPA